MKDFLRSRLLLIVGGYVALSALWIAFSDRLAARLSSDPEVVLSLNTGKGWLFVAVTASLLYGVLRRRDRVIEQRQESLKASAQELQAIYDAANEAIFVHDAATARIVGCNQRACEMFRYDRDRLMACSIADLSEGIPPYDGEHAKAWGMQALAQGTHLFEWRSRRSDGTCFWSEVSLRWSTIGGEPRALAAIRDITERKRNEAAIRYSEERFVAVFRTSPVAILITRLTDGLCLDVNDAFVAQTGYSRDELVGRSVRESGVELWVDPDERTTLLQQVEAGKVVRNMEAKFRRKDGSVLIGLLSACLFPIGSDTCLITAVVDITAKRALEDVMTRTERLESLGVLAGGIAHDFNNLLAGVFGYLDLARGSLRVHNINEAEESLSDALSVFGRARALTQQLLTFAKGGAPLRKTQAVDELVRKAVAFATSGSNCEVSFISSPEIWMCDVDEHQIGQTIDNLTINAKQAMPSGGRLDVRVENVPGTEMPRHLPARDHVHISMRDAGNGIPREHLPRIFDPFFTTKPQGSGLGLATVHSIVRRHDGHVEAESEVGAGSVFHIWLPRAQPETQTMDLSAADNHRGRGHVLVLDDEAFILNIAASILRRAGYEVSLAKNVEQTVAMVELAVAAGKPFRAAILDMTIPGGAGGKEIVHRLKGIDPAIKVLASSGYAGDDVMARPKDFGFDGSVPKPYSAQDLHAAMAGLFPGDQPQSDATPSAVPLQSASGRDLDQAATPGPSRTA
jgi:PAS domain S-box-containing protein